MADENGFARILLDDHMLRLLIQLSPDIRIRGVYWDAAWAGWQIHLEGKGLPPCAQGEIPQRLEAIAQWHQIAPHRSLIGYGYALGDELIAHIGWDRDMWPLEEDSQDDSH